VAPLCLGADGLPEVVFDVQGQLLDHHARLQHTVKVKLFIDSSIINSYSIHNCFTRLENDSSDGDNKSLFKGRMTVILSNCTYHLWSCALFCEQSQVSIVSTVNFKR
jgi:hypothetical protein